MNPITTDLGERDPMSMEQGTGGTPGVRGLPLTLRAAPQDTLLTRAKVALFDRFELVLVVVLLGSLLFINSFVVHKYAFLLFFFVPVLLAAFYLSARHAVTAAILTIGFVTYTTLMDPFGVAATDETLNFWNIVIWACFLLLTGALVGQLQEKNQVHSKQLRDAYLGIVHILIKYLEATDAYTKGHSERVASICVILAKRVGLAGNDIENVWFAALLHDIGKIDVIDLIRKAGPLDVDEKAKVDSHTELGAQLILTTGTVLNDVIPLVLDHHRRYDDGGDAIPMGARIIAVADTYDAILTDRPYRAGRLHFEAVEILERGAGTQFDPDVVDALNESETELLAIYKEEATATA